MNHCANMLWGVDPRTQPGSHVKKKHDPKQLITLRGKSKILVYTFLKNVIGNLSDDTVGNYHKFVSLYKKAWKPDQ